MKRLFVTTIATVGLGVMCSAAPALAFSPNPNPGYLNNCVGRTTSYATQGNDISPFISANGMGNVARVNDATTKDAMDYIKFVACA